MADITREVILGVDTHADTHTGVVIDDLGRVQATLQVPATDAGYEQLVRWARRFGDLTRAGVEGTGTYGAGLLALLVAEGVEVFEVDRPNRQTRRRRGKSDPTDAEAAARAVLAGEATAIPKTKAGIVESIRALRVARAGAIKARTQAANQLCALVVTAPEQIRRELRPLATKAKVSRAAAFRAAQGTDPHAAAKRALRHVARRYQHLNHEITELDADLKELVSLAAPRTLARPGVGIETAGQLLVTAGENIDRIHSEAALAALCGASPVPASSGKTSRHRLNRGGDRQANNALWRIAFIRMRTHDQTRDYAARSTARGRTRKETIRCLKRYIARELHPLLIADLNDARNLALTK